MNGPCKLDRADLQPRIVRFVSGLGVHQVEEIVALLRDIIGTLDAANPLPAAGRAVDGAYFTPAPSARDLCSATLADRLHAAYSASTAGTWCRGVGTHQTVAKVAGRPEYRIAEFRHADDAQFCDVVHELAPTIIRLLRAEATGAQERPTP